MNFLGPRAAADSVSPERNYLARIAPLRPEDIPASEYQLEEETPIPAEPTQDEVTEFSEPSLVIETKAPLGRTAEDVDIPEYEKMTMAVLAQDNNQSEIAKAFDVTQSSVSNFANGRDNGDDRLPNPNLQGVIQERREKIEDEALAKTLLTLGLMSENDLISLGAKDKSIVAQNLSRVAANLRGNTNIQDNRVQMIIHAPAVRTEHHYPEIEV